MNIGARVEEEGEGIPIFPPTLSRSEVYEPPLTATKIPCLQGILKENTNNPHVKSHYCVHSDLEFLYKTGMFLAGEGVENKIG